MSVQKGLDERRRISTADMISIPARAKFVRKLFYSTAIPACALCIGVLFGHQPYLETASRSMANRIVDVASLEATIDIKHLPRQDLSSEVYQ
jgi:hypothetical protein